MPLDQNFDLQERQEAGSKAFVGLLIHSLADGKLQLLSPSLVMCHSWTSALKQEHKSLPRLAELSYLPVIKRFKVLVNPLHTFLEAFSPDR